MLASKQGAQTMGKTPRYINSPSWRNARTEFIGWLGLLAFMFILMVVALMLTGGDL
jgi:hypothetical protein